VPLRPRKKSKGPSRGQKTPGTGPRKRRIQVERVTSLLNVVGRMGGGVLGCSAMEGYLALLQKFGRDSPLLIRREEKSKKDRGT